jgi:hypothetical protein
MKYGWHDVDGATTAKLRTMSREAGISGAADMTRIELLAAWRDRLGERKSGPIPLFVELCAGTAAVSLALERRGQKPFASRMGSKAGYAVAVLHALGLHPGQGATHYLWCEPDTATRVGLEILRRPALARAAAAIVRQWQDWPAGYRSLWDSLRARGEFSHAADTVTPEEAARYVVQRAWKLYGYLNRNGGYVGPDTPNGHQPPHALATRLEKLPEMPATVLAAAVEPPTPLPPGTVCYIDPPYVGTSPYEHDLPRADVVRLARAWAAAGATVAVSEQEAIPELVADGWSAHNITHALSGAGRTMSKQKTEYVTVYRPRQ